MKYHEREFFISLIRSGKVLIEKNDITLEIRPLTIEQSLLASKVYQKSYFKAVSEEFMTEEELTIWMIDSGIWTPYDDKIIEQYNKDIEKLKVDIYKSYGKKKATETIRRSIRILEIKTSSHLQKKHSYYSNTCEGIASSEKLDWVIKNTTYYQNKIYDFSEINLEYVISEFQDNILSEKQCRELARTDPWRSYWTTKNYCKLFSNDGDYELSHNQKNLLIWSQMYDNIQESVDCPVDDIINDDDMLDGWFIIQREKREKDKLQSELENSSLKNSKIKNSNEVFIMADKDDKQQLSIIDSLNDGNAKYIQNERFNKTQASENPLQDIDFFDQKVKAVAQANRGNKK